MFEGWDEFYLLIGSAAAVLIGLIFVVISLMQDRSRSSVITGSKLYVGPIVLGVSFVLVLSAAALMPGMTARGFAAIAGLVALWGLGAGPHVDPGYRAPEGRSALDRSLVLRRFPEPHLSSAWLSGKACGGPGT